MDSLYSEIANTIELPKDRYRLIEEHCSSKKYLRGETFINAGNQNTVLGFLEKGLFRSYFIDEQGSNTTTAFIEEGTFFTDLNSFPGNVSGFTK